MEGNAITSATHPANINPIRYRNYYYDVETGLYYLQSRYYDPETGRFLNADGYISDVGAIIGNNLFAYCLNNAINLSDATGNWPNWKSIGNFFKKSWHNNSQRSGNYRRIFAR